MLWTRLICSDEWKIDFRFHRAGEFNLRLLASFLEPLKRHLVIRKIDALIALELFDNPLDQSFVNIVTAKMRIAVGRLHFNHAFANFQNGNIKSAAAEVEHRD